MISDSTSDTASSDVAEPWEGDARLVREVILLVATHGAARVLVAGMAHGEVVMDRLCRPALEAGVPLRARPTADGAHVDVVVEVIR